MHEFVAMQLSVLPDPAGYGRALTIAKKEANAKTSRGKCMSVKRVFEMICGGAVNVGRRTTKNNSRVNEEPIKECAEEYLLSSC